MRFASRLARLERRMPRPTAADPYIHHEMQTPERLAEVLAILHEMGEKVSSPAPDRHRPMLFPGCMIQ